ncbi:MAG TPA: hypothetical protein VER08_11815 [Pyrinomonadaceae bacterium]|nr:hypothetical protein [Pyrinomonadaceae bacterium]
MEEGYSVQRLLALRKLTVAVSKLLGEQLRDYLTTLAPLLRPKAVLGDYVQGGAKEHVRAGVDSAFKELQALYTQVAAAKPFNLPPELKPPIEIISTALEFTPVEYEHAAEGGDESKRVVVTSPLTWSLNYAGFTLARLKELVADQNRAGHELRECVLHYLVLHVVLTKQTGVTRILETLHFSVRTGQRDPALGNLPVTHITSAVSTGLPPDSVIVESTNISGRDVFEEVVNVADIERLSDPLKERLEGLAATFNAGSTPAA